MPASRSCHRAITPCCLPASAAMMPSAYPLENWGRITSRTLHSIRLPPSERPHVGGTPGSVRLDDLVQSRALGRLAARFARRRDQLRRIQADAVVGARHARDVLLHQRAAQVVDAPPEALRL